MLVSCYLFIIQGSLHQHCVGFHPIFMSPLWLNHPGSLSWYLQMRLLGARLHNALQRSFISFCSAVKTLCSAVKTLCCAVCSSDSWDGGDYIFIRRGAYGGSRLFEGGRITFSSAPARESEERGRLLCPKLFTICSANNLNGSKTNNSTNANYCNTIGF